MFIRNLCRFAQSTQIINTLKSYPRQLHNTRCIQQKIYTENHDWLLDCGEYYKMGISNQALEELSEVVYVEFDSENNYQQDDTMVAIESVKAVADIKAPFDCKVIEKNIVLEDDFSCLNSDPECEDNSWILKLKKI